MSAVSYLHYHTILHGDLKPENIFLQSNYQVQLSDFGLAKIPSESSGSRFSSSNTQDAGTLRYMAPEFFTDTQPSRSPRSLPADIWALGWIFYMILTGLHPYTDMRGVSLLQIINCIQNHRIPLEPKDIPNQDDDLLRLQSTVWPIMRECWEISPTHRPKAEDIEQKLREVMLLEHSLAFGGPMFDSEEPDETRPSVIGDEEASLLELNAGKLRKINPEKARASLVAAALGYLCYGCKHDAYTTQIQIGWILIDQHQFLAAQTHFNAAQRVVDAGDLIVGCQRGLAKAAVGLGNFDEAIEHYYSALVRCRAGGFVDYEYMIIRETAIAVLEHPRNQDSPEEIIKSQNIARKLFKEALSFSMDPEHVNLEYQAQVRCDLVQLESNARNETTAQAHALAAFQCALETGRRSLADDVYNYLLETDVLSEAQLNAFRVELLDLHARTAHVPERGVDSLGSSWVASVS
ncbi:Serine/threonine-protein kinase ssp1 [Schizosaccharomyces pombe 972h-] [Rhizoctonia solani]|uniref:Serine/threonine-protein kinase ssp1 [Schizosaccharomyces pombe 972h-] n=1 Tax=Rhizoctonia solani TaxID=456999 RepID=A0A0K6FPF6_9AGAM|nr:Serine/threonine-protein kinase ssp1 [Schizosaccharomyces pombe 972h-] [Rhizoctonia solani]